MPELLPRWSKNGGPAVAVLPHSDRADGRTWTNLATNAEAREACGWEELPAVPAEVTMGRARVALAEAGLLAAVDDLVAEHGSTATQQLWAREAVIRRASPWVAELAAAVPLTDDQLDDLFRAAAEIP